MIGMEKVEKGDKGDKVDKVDKVDNGICIFEICQFKYLFINEL